MADANIIHYDLNTDTYHYEVTPDTGATVEAVITASPYAIDEWLAEATRSRRRLTVGLDVEWRPPFGPGENPVATLQLCVADRCLIVMLLHFQEPLPASLFAFLDDPRHRFVGVGIAGDARKLMRDHFLGVASAVDLGAMAACAYGDPGLRSAGLQALARRVVRLNVEKPRRVTLGRWDERYLSSEQIAYACIDAYASYLIGEALING